MKLDKSDYLAHLGPCQEFTDRFERLLNAHLELAPEGSELVLISDGAEWIAGWQKRAYPGATMILDFYHAVEHLASGSHFRL